MRATLPVLVTTAKLTSSTVAEPFAPSAYNAGTTYGLGEIVSVAADFVIYESLAASNIGNTPGTQPLWWRKIGVTEAAYNGAATYNLGDTCSANHRTYESLAASNTGNPLPVLPETLTDYWQDVGPTMRYAMFDLSRNTQTVGPSPLTAVIAVGERINTAGLTGMRGNTLLLKATSVSAGGTIFPLAYNATKTYAKGDCMTVGMTTCYQSLQDNNVGHAAPNATWWAVVSGAIYDLNTREVFDAETYCFEPFSTRPSKTVFDIPRVTDIVVTVTLTATSGNCKIGGLTLGTNIYLGKLLKPAKNTGVSYSTVSRDKYGNATLVKRPMLPKLSGTLLLPSLHVNRVLYARNLLDAEPALYTGTDIDDDWTDAVTIMGVHQQFDVTTSDGEEALIQFSAEEI